MNKRTFRSFLLTACLAAPVYFAIPAIRTAKPVHAASSLTDQSCVAYKKLFTLKTDSYQEMTISQFRERAVAFLDTLENMKLLEKALKDDQLRFHRFTDKNAFFIFNTLGPLAYDHWQNNFITGGVNSRLNAQLHAELEFRASIKILNPDILISEYENAYSGLADTALLFLKSQTSADLSNEASESTSVLEKKALKRLKKYAAKINKKGNLKINVKECMYGPADASSSCSPRGLSSTSYLPKPLSRLDVITYRSASSTISPSTKP